MAKKYYTNIAVIKDQILYRGVDDTGRRLNKKINGFRPVLFVPSSQKKTGWKSHLGLDLEPIEFPTIREQRDFIKKYEDVEGFAIYGNVRTEYQFIRENFPEEELVFDRANILVGNLDMEVDDSNGFPPPKEASSEITAITLQLNDVFYVFSTAPWEQSKSTLHANKKIIYYHATDEKDLLHKFLQCWVDHYPDIITGWNIRQFDIPYLIYRIIKLFGMKIARQLSPWEFISEKEVMFQGELQPAWDILGVAQLDLMQMFQKFLPHLPQENYRLDTVAKEIIGRGKVAYEGTLGQLYKNHPQKFVDYNIEDAVLVSDIDKKQGLIDLGLMFAYIGKVNYEDIFYPVRVWDTVIYNYLFEKKIAVPPKPSGDDVEPYEGAFVKPARTGFYQKGVASFDATSEYPSMIMMFNISPETMTGVRLEFSMEFLLSTTAKLPEIPEDCCCTANGYLFSKKTRGFLPALVEKQFNNRNKYKKLSLDCEAAYEKSKDGEDKTKANYYSTFEKAIKILINSFYGATGNRFFRFYDTRIAEAITMSGQYCIRLVIQEINRYLNKILKTVDIDYIIASDTDSIYIDMAMFVNAAPLSIQNDIPKMIKYLDKICVEIISPFIKNKVAEMIRVNLNAYEQRFIMKREILANRGIWAGKKHYVLNVWSKENVWYEKPKVKIVGLEAVKSSTPKIAKIKLKEAIELLMAGKPNSEIIKYIEDFREEFMKLSVEEIAFPKGVRGIDIYGRESDLRFNQFALKTPIHVRGSLVYNYQRLEKNLQKKYPAIKNKDKIKFLYLKEPNPFRTYVVAFHDVLPPEFEIKEYVDYETQFEKVFFDPMKSLLKNIGWHAEEFSTVDAFLGL